MEQRLTHAQQQELLTYLTEHLAGTDLDPAALLENLCEAAEDSAFARALREWYYRKSPAAYTDIEVHGYHLLDCIERFADRRFGLLFSLIPLYLEKYDARCEGIAAFIGHCCYADFEAVQAGIPLSYAYLMQDGCWRLLGAHRGMLTAAACARILAPYDTWPILMDCPALIPFLSAAYPIGTVLLRTDDTPTYQVLLPEDMGRDVQ